ncbi:Zinc finger CCHC-type superfamily [Arabidopsis suecica]|uniref:Zinc finger CCHC-type superfamily n=1 Tax=Arabidopsis suecica TaxID=45249 RepID=A0A8T2FVC6_ARASU|nr:Zinc finger CCHC-type superfamily [Arabidopsis suecica]
METTMQQVIPIFNGESYGFWKIKMITILKTRKLWDVIENGVTSNSSPETSPALTRERDDQVMKDMMALQILQSAVSDSIFPRIAPTSSATEAWNALEMEFQGSSQVKMINLQTLRREYENLKMEEGETINDFTTKLINLSNQLRVHGEEKSDYQVVQKILISVPQQFDSIVGVLKQTKDLSTLSVTELIGTLKAHERRLNLREDRINEGAFYGEKLGSRGENKQNKIRHGKTNMWCGVCKRNNHNEVDCFRKKSESISQRGGSYERRCYVCDKQGHIARDCKLRKGERAHLSIEESEDEKEDECHMLFSAVEEKEISTIGEETWLVDSGCTNHMSKDVRHFIALDRSKKIIIRIGNGGKVVSEGKGDIRVSTNKGDHVIKDVLYVPELARNLLSVSQMISNGYRVIFEDNKCVIQDLKGRKILDIKMKDRSFPIIWKKSREEAYMAFEEKEEQTDLWHKRFGHVNYDKIETMQTLKIVEKLPKFEVIKGICAACEMGKQSRRSFPKKSQSNTNKTLELIHSDVCGPMQTESINGSRYFLTFIDDFSRMTWVYFLKNKSEVITKFKIFKPYVENQSESRIKRLRTDGGGEFLSREFIKLCQESGIHHEITTPYSPQQNGVAERRNRTLVEMARSMIEEKKLSNKFWAEAIATSTYLQNRLPSKSLEKGVTPMEIWSGKKPSVDHLKVFGCVCYIHIPDEKRRKLDTKAKQGIFVGYNNESKGYRVFLLNEEKIEVSKDVTFDEKKTWSHDEKGERKAILSLVKINSQEQGGGNDLNAHIDQVSNAFNQLHISSRGVQNSHEEGEESVGPRGFRSINNLIDQTNEVEGEALIHEMCLMMAEEPQALEEAMKDEKWIEAMREELRMIEKNKTWEVVARPKDKNVISVKWIFRLKTDASGEAIKRKARLVARGFTQEYGVDYLETFAPVSRYDTIRTIMAIAAQQGWKLFQMDVKSAFLNGDLEEEVYIEQPPGFIEEKEEGKVLKLHKALYGLKQAPRAWYGRIDGYFIKNGFERSINDAAFYVKKTSKEILVVSLYVDDIIVTGSNVKEIERFKEEMKNEFEMTDLGELSYFLGMEVNQDDEGIFLSQENYAKKLLKKFGMQECKSVSTPLTPHGKTEEVLSEKLEDVTMYRSMIGGMLYLCASRPDIMYASSYLSRYMTSPLKQHLQEAKRVLRYVKGTLTYGIHFKRVEKPELVGFSDSDWAGSVEDKKSTSGYVFTIGSGAFCWNSSKQKTVAQSTAEAEYIAVCSAANQAIWLQRLVNEIGFKAEKGIRIFCDNKSAIAIGKNPVQHRRTKHIDIKYHFVREAEQTGKIKLEYCP